MGTAPPADARQIYSMSKSFTATALGLALAEDRLALTDTVVDHFPDLATAAGPRARTITVEHWPGWPPGTIRTRSPRCSRGTGPSRCAASSASSRSRRPARCSPTTTARPIPSRPILQKRTGQSLTDYLQPRLFDPLGIAPPFWDDRRRDPPGRVRRTAPRDRGRRPVRAALPPGGTLARAGGCSPPHGWPSEPRADPEPRRAGADWHRVTATSSGGPATATAPTGRSASSA